MNKLDEKQKEAIRTLSRLTATRTRNRGADWIDPFIENEENERNTKFIKSGFTDNSVKGESDDVFLYALPIRILQIIFYLVIFGIGFYGIFIAFMSA